MVRTGVGMFLVVACSPLVRWLESPGPPIHGIRRASEGSAQGAGQASIKSRFMGIEALAALMVALDRYAVPLTIAMCGQKPAAPVGRTVEREIVFGKGDADGSYKENIRSTGVP